MAEPISRERLTLLLQRAGLTKLSQQQIEDLRDGSRFLERMAHNVRRPRDRAAEPAHIFVHPRT